MTRSEAMAVLSKTFPGRAICLQLDDWIRPDGGRHCTYSVAVLPGWDDPQCSRVDGKSILEVVDLAVSQFTGPPPATNEEIERDFDPEPCPFEVVLADHAKAHDPADTCDHHFRRNGETSDGTPIYDCAKCGTPTTNPEVSALAVSYREPPY